MCSKIPRTTFDHDQHVNSDKHNGAFQCLQRLYLITTATLSTVFDSQMEGCGYDDETTHGDGGWAVTTVLTFKMSHFLKRELMECNLKNKISEFYRQQNWTKRPCCSVSCTRSPWARTWTAQDTSDTCWAAWSPLILILCLSTGFQPQLWNSRLCMTGFFICNIRSHGRV